MRACSAVSIDQLLSLRDGEPVEARVAQHVAACALCARELALLRTTRETLRELPQLNAPAHDAAALRSRLAERAGSTPRYLAIGALAASVCALAVTIFVTKERSSDDVSQIAMQAMDRAPSEAQSELPLSVWVERSQTLESNLRSLPRPRVERASTADAIDSLQNSIQWMDYQLSVADQVGLTPQQSRQLWQDRVQLLDTLYQVRTVEARRVVFIQ